MSKNKTFVFSDHVEFRVGERAILIDVDDYFKVAETTWTIWNGYARAIIGGKNIAMHNIIMHPQDGYEVDHINHNKLDNRKQNLRVVTHADNTHNRKTSKNNTSGYTGVCLRDSGKWRAEIKINGKHVLLGIFAEKQEAIAARKDAEQRHWGQYAPQN